MISGLPGEEIVLPGLRDLQGGRFRTREALLVLIARSRLIQAGLVFLALPEFEQTAVESDLYRVLCQEDAESAYGRYNSLKRRLDGFVRGLERRQDRAEFLRESTG